jgi:hypothetical protein
MNHKSLSMERKKMSGPALELGEYDFPKRNELAKATIQKYAIKHAKLDAAIGLAAFLPIAGAGPATILGSLAVQVPIYKSLARDLSRIYETDYDDFAKAIVKDGIIVGSLAKLTADVAGEFGSEFVTEIGSELVSEMGIGFAASFIPVIGGLFSMGLDVAVAATMTWRVGTMVAIYYSHGGKWIKDREETYERAKDMTGGLSPAIENRVNLDEIPARNKEVRQYQAKELSRYIKDRMEDRRLSDEDIRRILKKKNVPDQVIEEVIQLVRR